MNYFTFKLIHELLLFLFPLILLGIIVILYLKNKLYEYFYLSIVFVLYNLIALEIYPWRYLSFLPFGYDYYSYAISLMNVIVLVKSLKTVGWKLGGGLKVSSMLFIVILISSLVTLKFIGAQTPEGAMGFNYFPLRNGSYLVMQGGGSSYLNHHFKKPNQKFAMDIIQVCNKRFLSEYNKNSNFCIWERETYSICNGVVLKVEDGIVDNIPLTVNREKAKGNYVLIRCEDGHEILYAHLSKGTVNVKDGDFVSVDSILGKVGNSGNSTEPHLHIQVNFKEKSIPMLFGKKFNKRNDLIYN